MCACVAFPCGGRQVPKRTQIKHPGSHEHVPRLKDLLPYLFWEPQFSPDLYKDLNEMQHLTALHPHLCLAVLVHMHIVLASCHPALIQLILDLK